MWNLFAACMGVLGVTDEVSVISKLGDYIAVILWTQVSGVDNVGCRTKTGTLYKADCNSSQRRYFTCKSTVGVAIKKV